MHNEAIDENTHEETRAKYLRMEADLLKELARVRAVLSALGEQTDAKEEVSTVGIIPPIFDIQEYLQQRGEPCHQRDIIKAVGNKRKEMYPCRRHPYADVWKSLEYHNLYDREVVCVEVRGGKVFGAKLKDKTKRRRIRGGGIDRPDFYNSPDNWFGLKIWVGIELEAE